jgi:hypothetical protein
MPALAAVRAWADAEGLALVEDAATRGGAVFSPCGRWRYLLWRIESTRSGLLGIGMLNPSTADAARDDPTIRRCRALAAKARLSGLIVWNLFAFRATLPADLKRAPDPVGPANDAAMRLALSLSRRTILAWGAHGSHRDRDAQALHICAASGARFHALGFTASGAPRHPLYLPATTRCRVFAPLAKPMIAATI